MGESGFYNGLEIYRSQANWVIQGGNDPPNSTYTGVVPIKTDKAAIGEEFNPDLQYTMAGALAMARAAPGSSGTEFFITEVPAPSLDYNFTLFGLQTSGTSVNTAIEAMPTESTTGDSYLITPVTISTATIFADTQNGVLELRAGGGDGHGHGHRDRQRRRQYAHDEDVHRDDYSQFGLESRQSLGLGDANGP